jgi:hypothetical protein
MSNAFHLFNDARTCMLTLSSYNMKRADSTLWIRAS